MGGLRQGRDARSQDARDQARSDALEEVADQLLEADRPNALTDNAETDMMEVEVDGENEGMTLQAIADLQNFVNAVDSIAVLPPADEFVKIVPESRREEVSDKLLVASAYLNRLQARAELEWDI